MVTLLLGLSRCLYGDCMLAVTIIVVVVVVV